MPSLRPLACLMWLGCAQAAAAADFYSLQGYGLDDGLSQATVTALVEDDRGFLWVGTQEGLNRFDGHHFKIYRRVAQSSEGVASSSIDTLAVDAASRLWIGTDDAGLVVRDLRDGNSLRVGTTQGLSHATVFRLLLDGGRGAWAGTGNGVDHVDGNDGRVQSLVESDAIVGLAPLGEGRALAVDRRCRAWRVERHQATVLDLALPESAQCLDLRHDGQRFWLATRQHGLFRLDGEGRKQALHPAPSLRNAPVDLTAIGLRADGRVLLGYEDGAVHLLTPGEYGSKPLQFDRPLRAQVTAFHESASGVLWIGTSNRGLWRARTLSPAIRRDLLTDAEIAGWPSRSVRSVWRDRRYWLVGSDQGLLWREGEDGAWRTVEAIGTTSIRRIVPALQGGWWIGSHRGLWHLSPDGHAEPVPGLPHPQVTDLLLEGELLWVATRGGLARFRGRTPDPEPLPEPLRNSFLTALLRDSEGRLWVGSNERGLFRLQADGQLEQLYPGNRRLPHNSIWSLHESADAWWLGTFGAGLLRIDRRSGALTAIGEAQGLTNDVVYRIESDAKGRLWLSTNFGINIHDPATGSLQALLPGDGLRSREYNSGASFRDADGRLYFGGTDGLDILEPLELASTSPPARPLLTELRVLARQGLRGQLSAERSIDLGYRDRVVLSYRDSVFTLGLVAIDFSSPDTTRLRYRIHGLHGDWVQPQSGRAELLLSYLPAGNYRLEAQAAGRDGRFGDSRVLELQVLPPPWQHPLAYAAYVLTVLALLAWLASRIGASARAKRAQIALLNRTVAERTAELERANQALLQINRQLEQATRTDPLTQVSNRRDLQDWLQRESEVLRTAAKAPGAMVEPLLFFLLDIDDFKRINDSHGHHAGDSVLVEFARRLRGLSRERDAVVRWGGEEFLLLVRGSHLGDAPLLAERLRRAMADAPFVLDSGEMLPITCSIGFAPWPLAAVLAAEADWMQSVDLADRALYAAKRAGKNAWVGLLPGPSLDAATLRTLLDGAAPTQLPEGAVYLLHSTAEPPAWPAL